MTAKEREGFFARLLALTGQEAGPDPRSREGNGIESSMLLWKWQAMVGVISWSESGREKWYGPGRSREAHLWNVRKQGLGVTHDWTLKRKHLRKGHISPSQKARSENALGERRTVVPKSVKEISASENPIAPKPVLILLAGAAGAGKTTLYESQLRTVFPVLKASASPIEQAETDRERSRLTKEGHSFVYQDTTIVSQMIREAQDAGFDLKVFYVGTEDPNLNMGRVLLRVSNGGPFAALARIPDDYAHGLKHLPEAKKLADDLMLFDNTTHGRGHRLVAHFHAGELMKLARSVPKWAQRVFGKKFEKWLGSRSGSSRSQ